MADNSINLMPEDLREKEQAAAQKSRVVDTEPDLSVPGDLPTPKEDTKNLSGSKPSLLTKFLDLFAKKSQPVIADQVAPTPIVNQPLQNQPLHIIKRPEVTAQVQSIPLSTQSSAPVINNTKFHQPEKIVRARFVEEGSGVNLVPNSMNLKSWKQISILFAATFVGALIIVVIFYFGLITMNQTLNANRLETETKISEIESKLLSFGEINKEINKKGKEISLVYEILNKHIYWTNFFRLLEKYTTNEVYYTGFSAGGNGAMVLSAVGKDYAAVGRQLKILQQEQALEFVTEVDIASGTAMLDEDGKLAGVSFSITLVLNPNLFYYQSGL